MDRSIGALRAGLKRMELDRNTLVWFCSDNGGLAGVGHDAVGGLRGKKATLWEGGLRVPGVVEWPAVVKPRVTTFPASTMDIMPTLVDILDLPKDSMLEPVDGASIKSLLLGDDGWRRKAIPFHYRSKAALIDNHLKIVTEKIGSGRYLLFDLNADRAETRDLFAERPKEAERLRKALDSLVTSVANSRTGADYAEGRVTKEGPHGRFWYAVEEYQPYLEDWAKRPEYENWALRGRTGSERKRERE